MDDLLVIGIVFGSCALIAVILVVALKLCSKRRH